MGKCEWATENITKFSKPGCDRLVTTPLELASRLDLTADLYALYFPEMASPKLTLVLAAMIRDTRAVKPSY